MNIETETRVRFAIVTCVASVAVIKFVVFTMNIVNLNVAYFFILYIYSQFVYVSIAIAFPLSFHFRYYCYQNITMLSAPLSIIAIIKIFTITIIAPKIVAVRQHYYHHREY